MSRTARTMALVAVLALGWGALPPSAQAMPARDSAAPHVSVGRVITTELRSPWGLAFLPDGSALVTERDTALVKRIPAAGGPATVVGHVRGVVPDEEGGLLGIAVPAGPAPTFVLLYLTTATDNRIVRVSWNGSRLGGQTPILTGIPRSAHHNGGRLLIGPGDTLFASTGDAEVPGNAQRRSSLSGKVLHITFDGAPAPGNPFPRSPVYTLGHRNVQGLAFDSAGRLWATEFGNKDVDELNLLKPGGNYGWPIHEGAANDARFINPVVQWSPTDTASPSGLAILDDVAYAACLRGEVLWQVPLAGTHAKAPIGLRLGSLGRLRTVAVAPDGALWLVTSNTDGRGSPRPHDDRVLRLVVS